MGYRRLLSNDIDHNYRRLLSNDINDMRDDDVDITAISLDPNILPRPPVIDYLSNIDALEPKVRKTTSLKVVHLVN